MYFYFSEIGKQTKVGGEEAEDDPYLKETEAKFQRDSLRKGVFYYMTA